MGEFFEYSDEAVEYLRAKDATLARVIDTVGHVNRPMDGDMFATIVHSIVGQQVSTAAQKTVNARLDALLGEVTPEAVAAVSIEDIQACGTTFRKAEYIKDAAARIMDGQADMDAIAAMDDEDAIRALCGFRGIGRWTAEMILTFCLNRQNVIAFDDLGILRGMRMTYHHRVISRELFEKYRRRYSPYATVAALYLWEVSHGTVEGFQKDFAPKRGSAAKRGNSPK